MMVFRVTATILFFQLSSLASAAEPRIPISFSGKNLIYDSKLHKFIPSPLSVDELFAAAKSDACFKSGLDIINAQLKSSDFQIAKAELGIENLPKKLEVSLEQAEPQYRDHFHIVYSDPSTGTRASFTYRCLVGPGGGKRLSAYDFLDEDLKPFTVGGKPAVKRPSAALALRALVERNKQAREERLAKERELRRLDEMAKSFEDMNRDGGFQE